MRPWTTIPVVCLLIAGGALVAIAEPPAIQVGQTRMWTPLPGCGQTFEGTLARVKADGVLSFRISEKWIDSHIAYFSPEDQQYVLAWLQQFQPYDVLAVEVNLAPAPIVPALREGSPVPPPSPELVGGPLGVVGLRGTDLVCVLVHGGSQIERFDRLDAQTRKAVLDWLRQRGRADLVPALEAVKPAPVEADKQFLKSAPESLMPPRKMDGLDILTIVVYSVPPGLFFAVLAFWIGRAIRDGM